MGEFNTPSYEKRCQTAAENRIVVKDSCLDTEIVAYGPNPSSVQIEVPAMGFGTFNLLDSIKAVPGNSFPWDDTINKASDSQIYGDNICGNIEYRLAADDLAEPLLKLNQDTFDVEVAPQKDVHPNGEYVIYLEGTLVEYGLTTRVPFIVKVTQCQATIDIIQAIMGKIENMWY